MVPISCELTLNRNNNRQKKSPYCTNCSTLLNFLNFGYVGDTWRIGLSPVPSFRGRLPEGIHTVRGVRAGGDILKRVGVTAED
jgi:hypothetical protein